MDQAIGLRSARWPGAARTSLSMLAGGNIMFTGLIEDMGAVTSFRRSHTAAVLGISTTLPVHEIALGDSVAVNGSA